ncbi:hypothetical protein [Paenibacillus amylolyticus]|uniref:Uncharacterized protein n=1 Tax=Paenibacillus amylolyticus TaxID=1451 RepID=A0ABD8B234_PAEAM
MATLDKLSSAAILNKVSAEAARQIEAAAKKSENLIKEADTISEAAILKAKEQAIRLLNRSLDNVFLADNRGIRICDALGKELNQFDTPTSAYAMTVDPLNNKLYFIIETTSQPIMNGETPSNKLVEVTLIVTSLHGNNTEEIKKMQYNVPIDVMITGALDISPDDGKIIWISPTGSIQSMNTRGDELQELAKAKFDPLTEAVHATISGAGDLFWTALERETSSEKVYGIWKLEKGSKEIKKLISFPLPIAAKENVISSKVQIDLAAGKLYWNSYKKIESMNLDGTSPQVVYESLSNITGLELDSHLNRLYWLEQNHLLYRSTVDGKNIEQAISFEDSELAVKSIYIRTKADEAAGILQAAQRERQLASQNVATDISQANKEAYAYLSPAQKAFQAADAAFKEQIAPAVIEAEEKISTARTQYSDKKAQADTILGNATNEKNTILNQANENYKSELRKAKAEAKNIVQKAQDKLDDANAHKNH